MQLHVALGPPAARKVLALLRLVAMEPARVVLLIVDGIGDVSVPEFGDRTPLEVAHVPHLDAIAGVGGVRGRGLGTGVTGAAELRG